MGYPINALTGQFDKVKSDNAFDNRYLKLNNPSALNSYVWPNTDGSSSQTLITDGSGNLSWSTPSGGGDVLGPSSSVNLNIAIFDGTTGKVIKDGGKTVAEVLDRANHTGTQGASTISDFDTEVSNNTDVSANTAARHDAVTVTDSAEIDLTVTGQDITASIKASSIDETKLDASVNASLDLADSSVQPGDLSTVATSGDHTDLSNIGANTHQQIDSHIASTDNPHSVTLAQVGGVTASDVSVLEIDTATYDDVQDWLNSTQSAGKISGGTITDNGDGTATVAAGTGFIKISDSDTADTKYFDWTENNSLSLVDNDTNYIYVEYNSGSPQVTASTTLPSDRNTNVVLGLAYREGNTLHVTTAGQVIANYAKKTLWKDLEVNGKFQRVSGMVISETGTRNFATTSGSVYAGLTKQNISAFDSSGADTFTYYYRNGSGGWTKVTSQSQIDNTHYDDGSGTLATLSNSLGWRDYYGVHWVYMDIDGHMFVVYGQGDYLLGQAEDAQPPASIPDLLSDIGGLVGKIIIKKNDSSFTSIQSAFDITFVPLAAAEHNLLAGLQGGTADEYYHLTSGEHAELTAWLDDVILGASGALTLPTGQNFTIGTTQWNTGDDIDASKLSGTIPAAVLQTEWDAAHTHISESGASHTYIDQDVTSGSSPTFDGSNFTGIPDGALDTDYVEVAGDTMTGALVIDGSADAIQLKVQAHSTQNANILEIEDSGGTDLVTIDPSGNVYGQGFQVPDGGYVGYSGGAEWLFDNTNDDITTTSSVGIGMAGPSQQLHVYHATDNVVATFESGDSEGGVQLKDSNTTADYKVTIRAIGDELSLRAGGNEAMRIDSSGRVGKYWERRRR